MNKKGIQAFLASILLSNQLVLVCKGKKSEIIKKGDTKERRGKEERKIQKT